MKYGRSELFVQSVTQRPSIGTNREFIKTNYLKLAIMNTN